MLERTRFEREVAALVSEAPEYEIRVSQGQFGKALAGFAKIAYVSDAVIRLLRRSKTFASMVRTLDQKYLWIDSGLLPEGGWSIDWDADENGVLRKGPYQGRRVLSIVYSLGGSYFSPAGDSRTAAYDTIAIDRAPSQAPSLGKPVTLKENGEWIERIAHETAHAFRHVLGLRRAGKTAVERINGGIDDEIATRKVEGQVVGELRKQFPKFAPYQPTTGRLERWAVERDLVTVNLLRRTYLEHFVLNERLRAALAQLPAADAEKYEALVDRIDLGKRPLASYLTATPRFVDPRNNVVSTFMQAYPNLLLALRVLDARWRSVKDIDRRDLYRDADLEAMRIAHAAAYFDGITSYTNVP